jgi:hypothetical protein
MLFNNMSISDGEILRVYDLENYCDRKSFYKKCSVIETDEKYYLRSYDTIVCVYYKEGYFLKMWDAYSNTTMRHINAFMRFLGFQAGGKKWWDALQYNMVYNHYEIDNIYKSFY